MFSFFHNCGLNTWKCSDIVINNCLSVFKLVNVIRFEQRLFFVCCLQ